MLDPRAIVRWLYVGRVSVAAAILLAAVSSWRQASADDTLVATLAFAVAGLVTAASSFHTEVRRRAVGLPFLAAQVLCDLLVVTAVVHVTGGASSPFTALFILVIAAAALLLPPGAAMVAAVLADALYAMDAVWLRPGDAGIAVWLQVGVFGAVAVASGWIAAELRRAGDGRAWLAAELRQTRFEAADILRNIGSGIITVDATGRLLFANPAAESLLGRAIGERRGQPVLDELAAVSPELAAALRHAASDGLRTTRAEGEIVRDGQTLTIGVTTTTVEAQGGDDGARREAAGTAIFSDITAHKRLAALHLRAARLEAVAELSASLAHEIKNPLAAVRSAVEQLGRLAAAAVRGPLDEDTAEDVRTLAALTTRESDRLSRLLSEFLDFARARVTRVERVDLSAIARDAAMLAGAHPDRRPGTRLELELPATPVLADGDDELLRRAAFNLVLNAVQAAPGRVRVETHVPDAAELPPGLAFAHGAVALHVVDDGPGIPAAELDRVFDPFFTTKPGGSGLGLAVVQRAVEAHRGVVIVDGACAPAGVPGGGTRFTILLPRAASTAPTLAAGRPYLPTPPSAPLAVA